MHRSFYHKGTETQRPIHGGGLFGLVLLCAIVSLWWKWIGSDIRVIRDICGEWIGDGDQNPSLGVLPRITQITRMGRR
jgi:hypothetical protein